MCHEPLQHLDGPGGPTLFTFDLVTCHWSKLQVNGFDNTAVVGFGTHDGQVGPCIAQGRQFCMTTGAATGSLHVYHISLQHEGPRKIRH